MFNANQPPRQSGIRAAFPWGLAGLSGLALLVWILRLGPTLSNDEYAAIDYCHRIIHQAGFYPTPTRLHKPLAVLTGLSAQAAGPLGYEVVTAAWAVVLVLFSFLAVRRVWGGKPAMVISVLIATNPDLFLYSSQGLTVVPLAAGGWVCLHALLEAEENPGAVWRYSLVAFLVGLLRPDAWLFGLPLALAFWPRRRQWGYLRFLLAGGIIALAPAIWFGKDWWINGNLWHSVEVAMRDKTVALAKTDFTATEALAFFPPHLVSRISWPTFILGLAGAGLFLWRQGRRGLLHPLLWFPLLISGFVWYLIRTGVYPLPRYFFFTAVFLLMFAGYAGVEIWDWARTKNPGFRWVGTGFLLILAGLHLAAAGRRFQLNCQELKTEAQIQQELAVIADTLRKQIPSGERPVILLPARRDEQLSWLFRDREIPNTLTFREAMYHRVIHNYPFLYWEPRWIIYVAGDFPARWIAEEFQWLGHQDRTELMGAEIYLVQATPHLRLFRVSYPPGWQTPPPPPAIRPAE